MPLSFLAISIHTPSVATWLSSSHSSHSAAEAKRSCGSSPVPTGERLMAESRRAGWRRTDAQMADCPLAAKAQREDLFHMDAAAIEGVAMKSEGRSSGGVLTRLVGVSVGAALLAAALPTVAGATDYCVAPNDGCGANNVGSVEAALDSADNATDADRIFLGDSTYTAPAATGFNYSAANSPVEIIGEGTGRTILTSPTPAPHVLTLFGGPGTTIHDLTIQLPQNAAAGPSGLYTTNTARRVEVVEDATQANERFGVELVNGGVLEDSSVTLDSAHNSAAVRFESGGGTVRHSVLRAWSAVESRYGGTVERSQLTGTGGVVAGGGVTTVSTSVIRLTGSLGMVVGIYAGTGPGTPATVNGDGVTIVGPSLSNHGGGFTGAIASSLGSPSERADVSLTNSIIRGVATPLSAYAPGAGKVAVTVSYSDYDPSGNSTTGANASINDANVSDVGDAGFVDAFGGDFHLRPDSPLVDMGDPATAQGLDLDGNPLVADGNRDGAARRDLGAFELPGPAVDQPAAGGGPQNGGGGGDGAAVDSRTPWSPASGPPRPCSRLPGAPRRWRQGSRAAPSSATRSARRRARRSRSSAACPAAAPPASA